MAKISSAHFLTTVRSLPNGSNYEIHYNHVKDALYAINSTYRHIKANLVAQETFIDKDTFHEEMLKISDYATELGHIVADLGGELGGTPKQVMRSHTAYSPGSGIVSNDFSCLADCESQPSEAKSAQKTSCECGAMKCGSYHHSTWCPMDGKK